MLGRIEDAFRRVTEFTTDASHELRTPVALMRTTAEVALRKPQSNEDYRQALEDVHAESLREYANRFPSNEKLGTEESVPGPGFPSCLDPRSRHTN
jgi:hypothetical protein